MSTFGLSEVSKMSTSIVFYSTTSKPVLSRINWFLSYHLDLLYFYKPLF